MDNNDDMIINNIEDSNQFYLHYDIKNNKSSNILSKYEKTMVIFERAQLISNGSKPYVSNPEKYNTINEIVEEEVPEEEPLEEEEEVPEEIPVEEEEEIVEEVSESLVISITSPGAGASDSDGAIAIEGAITSGSAASVYVSWSGNGQA